MPDGQSLPSWNDSAAKSAILDLVARVTKQGSADSDEAGHAFQKEAGHLFRSEAGRDSDLMSATRVRFRGSAR
jgi:hypothetical protein